MRARFIGDPGDRFSGPQTITVWGHEFVKGEWRDVTNERFANHSHFEFEAGEVVETPLPDADELRAKLDDLGVKYHHKAGAAKLAELLEAASQPEAVSAEADEEEAGA